MATTAARRSGRSRPARSSGCDRSIAGLLELAESGVLLIADRCASLRTTAFRAAHCRGDLPSFERLAAQGQQPRASRALRRRDRQGQDRHHRARPGRAAGSRLTALAHTGVGVITLTVAPALRFPSPPPTLGDERAIRESTAVGSRKSLGWRRWNSARDNTIADGSPEARSIAR